VRLAHGFVTGLLAAGLRRPPFIATLGLMSTARGAALRKRRRGAR